MKRVRTIFSGVAGTPYYSNMYFGDGTTTQDAIDAVGSFWNAMAVWIVSECTWTTQGAVAVIDPVSGDITGIENGNGINYGGEDTGEMLPPANQALVRWTTGVYEAGRQIRGRTFIPALSSSINDEGRIGVGVVTSMQIAVGGWLALAPPLLIWSRAHGVTAIASSFSVWEQFAQQRSRRD